MVKLTTVDWVMGRRSPSGLQNLFSIEWNKEISTRFLGNKEVSCLEGARAIHPISNKRKLISRKVGCEDEVRPDSQVSCLLPNDVVKSVQEETTTASKEHENVVL